MTNKTMRLLLLLLRREWVDWSKKNTIDLCLAKDDHDLSRKSWALNVGLKHKIFISVKNVVPTPLNSTPTVYRYMYVCVDEVQKRKRERERGTRMWWYIYTCVSQIMCHDGSGREKRSDIRIISRDVNSTMTDQRTVSIIDRKKKRIHPKIHGWNRRLELDHLHITTKSAEECMMSCTSTVRDEYSVIRSMDGQFIFVVLVSLSMTTLTNKRVQQ